MNKSKLVQVLVQVKTTKEMADELNAMAAKLGVSRPVLIRRIFSEFLRRSKVWQYQVLGWKP